MGIESAVRVFTVAAQIASGGSEATPTPRPEQQVDWNRHDKGLQAQVERSGRGQLIELDDPMVYGVAVLPSIGGRAFYLTLGGTNGTYALVHNAECVYEVLSRDGDLGEQVGKKYFGIFNPGIYTPKERVEKMKLKVEVPVAAGTPTLLRMVSLDM